MYRILIADDEPIVKVGLRKLLEPVCAQGEFSIVATAANGVEALRLTELNSVDIVITDLKMPSMDGITLIKNLKACGFRGAIFVLSNHSDFELVREALTVGALDYILKINITKEILAAQLNKAVAFLEEARRGEIQQEQQQNLLKSQQKQLSMAQLRDYFVACGRGSALPNLDADFVLQPSFLAVISFQRNASAFKKSSAALRHANDILAEIFEDAGEIIVMETSADELTVLIGAHFCEQNEATFCQRMKQFVRQSSIYFSLVPEIIYAPAVESATQAARAYRMCHNCKGQRFYTPAVEIFAAHHCPELVADAQPSYRQLIDSTLKSLRSQDSQAIIAAIRAYHETCAANAVAPSAMLYCAKSALDVVGTSFYMPQPFAMDEHDTEAFGAITSAQDLVQWLQTALLRLHRQETGVKIRPEIEQVLAFIGSHYTEKLELDDIARAACLNRSYLCRLLKTEMGTSLFQYINKVRMEQAAELFRQSDSPLYVKEIAAKVGIDDPFYFTRKFKEYFGVSPSEFMHEPKQDAATSPVS